MSAENLLWLGALGLLLVGLYGLLTIRSLLQVIVALQLLGKAAVLALIAGGRSSGHLNLGQSMAVTVIVADTIVAVIGLALAIQIKRRLGTLDLKALATLRR